MSRALDGLRAATRDIHAGLHHHPAFAPVMRAPPDVAGYARLIGLLHGFHAPAEAWLFQAAAVLLPELNDLPQRRKAHLLQADMAALRDLCPAAILPPACAEFVLPFSRPAVLGGLYVLEGATLGGRELGRAMAPALQAVGLDEGAGVRFFGAYGLRQGAMWRAFCAILDQAAGHFTPAVQRDMEQAARDVFTFMESWLTEHSKLSTSLVGFAAQ